MRLQLLANKLICLLQCHLVADSHKIITDTPIADDVLGYYHNLGILRYGTNTASCLKKIWEKPFFLLTEALFNHAVKLHGHWFVQCVKNEPIAWQLSSTANTQYSFRISGNRGYDSNRALSLSILHFVLRLF